MFLPDPTQPTDTVTSTCSAARRWLLESINRITDLPLRAKNSISRDLAHHSRWTARTTRNPHPSSRPCYDATPLSDELTSGFHEIRLDIPTSCVAMGFLYLLTSQQREFHSIGPTPPNASLPPPLMAKLEQQKVQLLRGASIPPTSGHRIRLRSPLFSDISGREAIAFLQDLFTSHLSTELAPAGTTHTTPPPCQVEDMP
jgi:hypothetical protein